MDGHSGKGLSYWSAWGKCCFAAHLNELHGGGNDAGSGARIGTLGHAFAELYYGGYDFRCDEVIFKPVQLNDEVQEATRVFDAYREKFHKDEFGKVLSLEEKFEGPAVEAAVGIAPFTGKTDMVVELGDEACIEALKLSRPGLADAPLRPGMILGVDHKFLKARQSNQELKYPNSLQFIGYQVGYNATHERKVEGWIVNVIIRTKTVQFYTMFVPPPTQVQINALRASLKYWQFLSEEMRTQTNPLEDYCFGWSEPCWWLRQGMCDRGQGGEQLVQIKERLKR